ncbi:hypothetical protein PC119_g26202 [Phytophthora cactorum]|nr:hypothetical protein PC119_g26202 [Phytophthora cactorum]
MRATYISWTPMHRWGNPFAHILLYEIEQAWRICYVHMREGCPRCSQVRDRPTREDWDVQFDMWGPSDEERRWIGRYERSLSQRAQSQVRRGGTRRDPSRGSRSRSRPRGRHREAATRRHINKWGGGGGPSRRKAGPSRRRGTSEQSPWRVAGFVLGTVGGLRGPQATPDLERLSIEQYRLMMADAQQERDDALDAYQLAESAQREAGVASKLAAREQRDRWELLERFRRLETAQLGAPQVGGLSLEQRGLGSSRRQRRRRTSGGDA